MARLPRLVVAGHPHLHRSARHNGQPVVRSTTPTATATWTRCARPPAPNGSPSTPTRCSTTRSCCWRPRRGARALGRMMQALGPALCRAPSTAAIGARGTLVGWSLSKRGGRDRALPSGRACARRARPVLQAWSSTAADYRLVQRRAPPGAAPRPAGRRSARGYWALGNTPFEREAAYRARC